MLYLVKCFSASIERTMWWFSLLLLICSITLIDLQMLNHTCIPGINATWSWWIIFLMYCWLLLTRILLRILASIFIRDIGLKFSFFGRVFAWFGDQGNAGFIKRVWKFSFCFNFLKQLQRPILNLKIHPD